MPLVLAAPDIRLFYTETVDVKVDRQNYADKEQRQKQTINVSLTSKK